MKITMHCLHMTHQNTVTNKPNRSTIHKHLPYILRNGIVHYVWLCAMVSVLLLPTKYGAMHDAQEPLQFNWYI